MLDTLIYKIFLTNVTLKKINLKKKQKTTLNLELENMGFKIPVLPRSKYLTME